MPYSEYKRKVKRKNNLKRMLMLLLLILFLVHGSGAEFKKENNFERYYTEVKITADKETPLRGTIKIGNKKIRYDIESETENGIIKISDLIDEFIPRGIKEFIGYLH